MQPASILNLGIYMLILVVVASGALIMGPLVGPKKKGKTKESPYECGSPVLSPTRSKFDVRFFMLAMLFILFDIELVLLIPYAIQLTEYPNPWEKLAIAGLFFIGLVESLIYAWKRGALDWK